MSPARRLVKLPLRKHHSFHFQPSQTVAGAVRHSKKHHKTNNSNGSTSGGGVAGSSSAVKIVSYNEKRAFKPITPMPKSPCKSSDENESSTSSTVKEVPLPSKCSTAPRTSAAAYAHGLRRHASNSDAYAINRYKPKSYLTDEDEEEIQEEEDQAQLSDSTYMNGLPTAAAGDARKRLHYADLVALGIKQETAAPAASVAGGSTVTTKSTPTHAISSKNGHDEQMRIANHVKQPNGVLPKRATEYATLKFNEVSI